jgi:hypothetical protein
VVETALVDDHPESGAAGQWDEFRCSYLMNIRGLTADSLRAASRPERTSPG